MPQKTRPLFRPSLGPKPPRADPATAQIARINELTRVGKANWFALLAYLAFAFITVLGVQDADFFIDSRQTRLPLIGVDIPTFSFFIFAPALGAALYIYLHLHIRKLIDAIAEPPAIVDGMRLEERLNSWLLNDVLLRWRDGDAATKRPLDWLAITATVALIWLAGPLVQFAFYWRSWPAHEEGVTLYLALAAILTLHAGLTSWTLAWRIRGRPKYARARTGVRLVAVLALAGAVGLLGWVKTEGGQVPNLSASGLREPSNWLMTLAPVRMVGLEGAVLPPEKRDPTVARHRFRAQYCNRLGIPPDICGRAPDGGTTPPVFQAKVRDDWCATKGATETCTAFFRQLDRDFRSEWRGLRSNEIASLSKPIFRIKDLRHLSANGALLTGVDLRGAQMEGASLRDTQMERANLSGAQMKGAGLSFAQMEGADLSDAQMEGAFLSFAQMEGADLSGAQMEGAVLSNAQMKGASLSFAQMEGAFLSRAQMEGADLSGAQMEGAVFSNAQMEGAVLRGAQMEGAVLRDAQMEGADLSGAQMEGVGLSGAQMEGADLSDAQMEGADLRDAQMSSVSWSRANLQGALLQDTVLTGARDLTQGQLDGAIGNSGTVLPAALPPFRVASCWEEEPDTFEKTLTAYNRFILLLPLTPEEARARWLCSDENPKVWHIGPLP